MPKSVSRKLTTKSKWRNYQKSNQSRRTLFLGIGILVLLVFLIAAGRFLKFIQGSHLTGGLSYKSYEWSGSSTLNLVIKADKVYVMSYNPQAQSLTILKVPDETYMDLPFGFGRWSTRSIYSLGEGENPPIGAQLLTSTISFAFGIPVDGFLIAPEKKGQSSFENTISGLRQNPFNSWNFISQYKSDLDTVEMARLWWGMRGLRPDKVRVLDLGQSQITDWLLLADGSRVLGIDPLKLDQYLQDNFKDSKIDNESVSIGVFNATSHPQLAGRAAREISNMGGRVIFTTNLVKPVTKSLVMGGNSYTTNRLAQVFAPACQQKSGFLSFLRGEKKCLLEDPNLDSSRATINIVLGEDYYLRYNKR